MNRKDHEIEILKLVYKYGERYRPAQTIAFLVGTLSGYVASTFGFSAETAPDEFHQRTKAFSKTISEETLSCLGDLTTIQSQQK